MPNTLSRAAEIGRAWAEAKADSLEEMPAMEWPDVWDPVWAGPLPPPEANASKEEREALLAVANHYASEHWAELLTERRNIEDVEDEEHDDEARALHLLEAIERDLPQWLSAGRDGPRVYVQDTRTGMEMTVRSLEHAWRVVADWEEQHV